MSSEAHFEIRRPGVGGEQSDSGNVFLSNKTYKKRL